MKTKKEVIHISNIDYTKKTYKYSNESFSGCDMTASITVKHLDKKSGKIKNFTYVVGEIQTISYSINMDKAPVRSIGNVNAKDYVAGQRTIAGSIVFNVFNKHFSKELMDGLNANYDSGDSYLVDEIPPFDVTISAANEYGYRSKLCIFGIRLLNEGQVMSINDVFVENTYQFYATDVDYLDSEMKYARNKNGQFILKGNNVPWLEKKIDSVKRDREFGYDNYGYKEDKTIKLSCGVKQPKKTNGNGVVDFYITPGIAEGTINIIDALENSQTLTIRTSIVDNTGENKWYKNNKTSHVNKLLKGGSYTAQAKTSDGIKSNKVFFNIDSIVEEDKLKKYAPLIKNITESSFVIYSNEPLHDKAKVSGISHDLINGKCYLEGLNEGALYSVQTYSGSTGESSRITKVKTRSNIDAEYKKFGLYIYSNSSKLIYTGDTKRYMELLKEGYTLSKSNGIGITDALLLAKKAYNKGTTEEDRLSSKMLGELITLKNKSDEKIKAAMYKNSLCIPRMFEDSNLNTVFVFDKDVTFAEFYKTDGKISYFKQGVDARIFKTIESEENCFRYIGEPGTHGYVEAVYKDKRSDRLDFYTITKSEREDALSNKKKETNNDIYDRKKQIAKREIGQDLSSREIDQAILFSFKDMNEKVAPPVILYDDAIVVSSNLGKISKDPLYYAFHSVDDVLSDNLIFRTEVGKEPLDLSLYEGTLNLGSSYACTIEDKDFNQISKPATFTFGDSHKSDTISEYELLRHYPHIKEYAVQNNMYFENNSIFDEENMIEGFLHSVASEGGDIEDAVSNIYDHIIIRADSKLKDEYFSYSSSYSVLNVECLKECSIVIYDTKKVLVEIKNLNIGSNRISLSDRTVSVIISKDLIMKSDPFILTNNNIREVKI